MGRIVFSLTFSHKGENVPVKTVIGIAPSFEAAVQAGIDTFDRGVIAAGGDPEAYSLLSVDRVGRIGFVVDRPDTGGFDTDAMNVE